MATISPVVISNSDQTWYVSWTLGNADTGLGAEFGQYPDRTIGVNGTFGGATVTIEGSMDNATWSQLHDFTNTPIAFTSSGLFLIAENPLYVRARTSGGSGTSLIVTCLGSRS